MIEYQDTMARKQAAIDAVLGFLPENARLPAKPMLDMLRDVAPLEMLEMLVQDARWAKDRVDAGDYAGAQTVLDKYGIPASMVQGIVA